MALNNVVFELTEDHNNKAWTRLSVEGNSDGNEFHSGNHYNDSPVIDNFVMEKVNNTNSQLTESPTLKNDSNAKSFEEENQLYFKIYNKRRLSDSFPDFQHLITDSLNSTLITKKLSKFLPLLLIQGLTKIHLTEKDVSVLSHKECKEDVSDILQSLLAVMKASIKSPSKTQTLEYCQTVLEETTVDVDESSVICYFIKNLMSSDPLLKHAALALLYSYCSERQFKLPLVRNLLKILISLYNEDNLDVLRLSWKTVNALIQNLKHGDQIKIVPDVCLAVKLAVFDSKNEKYLPGLCHSEGFDSIFPLYEKVMLKGILKDQKLAAQALHQLILFSSEDALESSLCSLASVLICIILKFKDEPYVRIKIALVETLTTLLAKVGIKLKLYYPQIQSSFLTTMRSDNCALQLRCIRGLCCIVRFNAQLDALYDYLLEAIIREGFCRKRIMLFALRCVLKCACVQIPEKWCRKLSILVLSMLDFSHDACRITAAGCFGTIMGFLPPLECEKVMKLYFLDDYHSLSLTLRHSKCTALMVALKEYPAKLLLKEEMSEKICEVILSYMTSHKVDIVTCSIKACGYFMLFKFSLLEKKINPALLVAFCETMNHNSEEVKYTFAIVTNFLANRVTVPLYVIKQIVPFLINGVKEGPNKVKTSCEFALIAVLGLYNQDEISQMYLNTLESSVQETFRTVIMILKALAKQPKPKEEELDFTVM